MSDQRPAIGDRVHYVSYGTPGGEYTSQCRAATITEVAPESEGNLAQGQIEGWGPAALVKVGLFVMNPTGLFLNQGVLWDPNKAGGTWHWPEAMKPPERAVPTAGRTLGRRRTLSDLGMAPAEIGQESDEWLDGVDPITQARIAYGAYGAVTDHKNYQGLPMPAFEELPGTIRDAWTASATKLFELGAAWGRFQPERAANGAPGSTEAARLIFEAIGEASMCWAAPSAAGEFDSTHAAKVGLDLMRRLGIPIPPHYERTGGLGWVDNLAAKMDAQASAPPESEQFQREVPEGSPLTGWLPAEDARPEAGVEPEDT